MLLNKSKYDKYECIWQSEGKYGKLEKYEQAGMYKRKIILKYGSICGKYGSVGTR